MAAGEKGAAVIGVLLKHVDLHPTVDPLRGQVRSDPRGALSAADQSALAVALAAARAAGGAVRACSAGPVGCEAVLRTALAAGAAEAVRVDLPAGAPSVVVAAALAPLLGDCTWVLCGDASSDRGSGAVPAFLAGFLSWAQALGATALDLPPGAPARVERRLDGGRREVLSVHAPGVISVEPGTASLARASLPAVLAAASQPISVVVPPGQGVAGPAGQAGVPSGLVPAPGTPRPFRPRPRVLSGPDPALPAQERVRQLSGALAPAQPARVLRVSPEQAAAVLLDALETWGYLPAPPGAPPSPLTAEPG